jgi:ribosomal peptide maturation radical SAM protein 1
MDILPPQEAVAPLHADAETLGPELLERRRAWPVALVNMPFVSIYRPSLQLGLLKAIGERQGFPSSTFHLNLDLASQIGPKLYEQLVHHRGRLFGDWLFSVAAFGTEAPDPDAALLDAFPEEVTLLLADLGATREDLLKIRRVEIPRYLDRLVETVPWQDFRIVGFTSTFQQSVAAFALARRLKASFPHLVTVFGGANFEGEMGRELARATDCVDYAVIGEGDEAYPEFLIALSDGLDPCRVPGIVSRHSSATEARPPRQPFRALDALPVPDYQEYFDRAAGLGLVPEMARRLVYLPFESSRGCWWGQKHHCTFCGLNGQSMAFRAKTPDRVREELAELARRYRSFMFEAVDNIVDTTYLASFFPRLATEGSDYEFFYEVKSNLTREKLRLLRDGGVRRMQPGIESLSTHVLGLMRKGVSAAQNVNLLRWALYYGIEVGWNIIWGFPGETVEDYERQLALLPHLAHLQPPTGAGRIWMERFSPIFSDRRAFPATVIRPEASYAHVYPRSIDTTRVAYFFDYELENTLPAGTYDATRDRVRAWQAAWKQEPRPSLTFWSAPGFLQIEDLRSTEGAGVYTFDGPLAAIYAGCSERPQSVVQLQRHQALPYDEAEIEDAMNEFCARGLMMRDGDVFLSLALPASRGR